MIGARVKLIKRVTKSSKAEKGDVGTIEDFSADGDIFIRWDTRPHELDRIVSGVDQWVGFPPPSDD